jgi:lipid-binding SYLF domain-containing protein
MKKRYQKIWKEVKAHTLLSAVLLLCTVIMAAGIMTPTVAGAATAAEIDGNVDAALQKLYASSPTAKELSKVAKGIVIFPEIVKGGVIIGGQYGEGALRTEGKTAGYYNTVAASYGLQLGLQKFGYAMFLMTDSAMEYLNKSSGWEIGVGPSVVVVDEGVARSLTTSTAKEDVYAFFFGQKGLMAGMGLQGSKISRITPDKK